MIGVTELAIPADHRHLPITRGSQPPPRPTGHIRADIDRRHRTRRPGKIREQRRVVTRPRADFEHPVPRPDIELIQHPRGNPRRRGRTDSHTLSIPVRDDHLVRISILDRDPRHEKMPRH